MSDIALFGDFRKRTLYFRSGILYYYESNSRKSAIFAALAAHAWQSFQQNNHKVLTEYFFENLQIPSYYFKEQNYEL